MEMPVTSRRPPSLPIVCIRFPDQASFSVLRETPMAFSCDYFKKQNCYKPASFAWRALRIFPKAFKDRATSGKALIFSAASV